jgi:biotin operon repressor
LVIANYSKQNIGILTLYDILLGGHVSNKDSILMALKKSGEPMKSGDIEKATGLKKSDLAKGIEELKKEGKIDSPKRCFYAVKK